MKTKPWNMPKFFLKRMLFTICSLVQIPWAQAKASLTLAEITCRILLSFWHLCRYFSSGIGNGFSSGRYFGADSQVSDRRHRSYIWESLRWEPSKSDGGRRNCLIGAYWEKVEQRQIVEVSQLKPSYEQAVGHTIGGESDF